MIAALIFVAGVTPGLIKHGQPLPHSGRNVAQPVAAYSATDDKPSFLALLSRWKKA